jgi:O-antigen ligase
LAILVFLARDALFVDSRFGMTGYGIVNRVGTVADMSMSRSSGMARFAAVPGIVCFVLLWQSRGVLRFFYGVIFLLSGALIYLMQSRGAIFGLAFAIFFVMLFMGAKERRFGAIFLILLGLTLYADVIPERKIEQVTEHLTGTRHEELETMTGRTRAWEKGWKKVPKSPVWGYGPQADRYLIKEHIHNTYMYALMSSGFAGAAAFAGGLVWAWVLFLRAIIRRVADRFGQRLFLIQAGGILAFFTVRSIPEVCGAMFGVDLMVMLPVLAYLAVLDQKGREDRELKTENGELRTEG